MVASGEVSRRHHPLRPAQYSQTSQGNRQGRVYYYGNRITLQSCCRNTHRSVPHTVNHYAMVASSRYAFLHRRGLPRPDHTIRVRKPCFLHDGLAPGSHVDAIVRQPNGECCFSRRRRLGYAVQDKEADHCRGQYGNNEDRYLTVSHRASPTVPNPEKDHKRCQDDSTGSGNSSCSLLRFPVLLQTPTLPEATSLTSCWSGPASSAPRRRRL
jgi:hypothetical protein